jgi:hypothetical protein
MTAAPHIHAGIAHSRVRGLTIDLFCRVIDNWGDLGVCWRLARQLRDEYDAKVRLIVDDLSPFAVIEPRVDRALDAQTLDGIEIDRWSAFEFRHTGCKCDLAIEAFACDPPATYVESMAARSVKPVWINLEYLSAEAWVDGVHGLPSPHPKFPLTKYFFVPGFTEKSGGLIREATARWSGSAAMPPSLQWEDRGGDGVALEANRGVSAPTARAPRVFCFTYAHAPVAALTAAFESAGLVVASPLDQNLSNGSQLSPVPQTAFDDLLADFDLLLVRGEDSFVRAQLAGKPMLWHIYPTDDRAHIVKLDAWLDRYCESMPDELSKTYRRAAHAFVDPANEPDPVGAFRDFAATLPALREHALGWQQKLFACEDLATRLLRFVAEKR